MNSKKSRKLKPNTAQPNYFWRDLLRAVPLALSGLIVALALSWLLLAQFNFSYGFWHDHAGIGEAIDQYGPANQYRHGFHLTSREQRVELFAGINKAIHQGGEGLQELSYSVPGYSPQTLLREPEIIHLQDVANLVGAAVYLVVAAAALWISLLIYFARSGTAVPSLRLQLGGTSLFVVTVGIAVLLIGPVKVFYALHVWLFPDEHQWFFYYQESLMSTMMKAPDLFGWIALEWLFAASVFFVLLQVAAAKVVVRAQSRRAI